MRTTLLLSLFFVAVTASAQARLGEGPDQLVERYGVPVSKSVQKPEPGKIAAVLETFQKNGFSITVTLLDGMSAAESFKKLSGAAFTSEEVQTLLADNSAGRSWQAPQMVDGRKQWMRDDGSMATLDGGQVLTLISLEMLNAETTEKQLETAPSLQGF